MAAHLTMEQRQLARRLDAKGLSLREIGRQVGCFHQVVRTVVRRESKYPVPSDAWRPSSTTSTRRQPPPYPPATAAEVTQADTSGSAAPPPRHMSPHSATPGPYARGAPPRRTPRRSGMPTSWSASRHAPNATRPRPPGPGRSLRVLPSTLFWTAGWSGVAQGRLPPWLRTNRHPTSLGALTAD